MEHTPGPWKESELFFGQPNRMVVHAGERQVADCGLVDSEEQRANARLIAAAPDLLEACRAVADVLRNLPPECINPPFQAEAVHETAYERLMNVISQATGEEYEE